MPDFLMSWPKWLVFVVGFVLGQLSIVFILGFFKVVAPDDDFYQIKKEEKKEMSAIEDEDLDPDLDDEVREGLR